MYITPKKMFVNKNTSLLLSVKLNTHHESLSGILKEVLGTYTVIYTLAMVEVFHSLTIGSCIFTNIKMHKSLKTLAIKVPFTGNFINYAYGKI